nr:hypothetical protein [Tanacetum cinerariifolium]
VRQTQLVDTDTESDPEEAPSKADESQPLGSRVPLMSEDFEAYEPTTCMSVRAQPTMSPGHSARVAEAMALSDLAFCKRYRSSYETPSPSLSLTLSVQKRYIGTSELILDSDGEGDELGKVDTEEDEKDEGLGLKEEEAALEGQQQAVPVVETTVSEPLGHGYGALRRRELAVRGDQVPSTFEVGQSSRVYTDFPAYVTLAAHVLTSLPVSPSSPVVPSPIASPVTTPKTTISVDEDQFIEERLEMRSFCKGHVDTRMADMSQARYDDHRPIHDMLVQEADMQRELQEMRGRVTALEQERSRRECVINKGKCEVLGIEDEYIWEFIEGQLFDFFQGREIVNFWCDNKYVGYTYTIRIVLSASFTSKVVDLVNTTLRLPGSGSDMHYLHTRFVIPLRFSLVYKRNPKAIKMEHYLSHTDYPIWQVIHNGNGHVSVTTDTNGIIKVFPPKTAAEVVARKRERKARTTLLMALPEDHLEKFHKMADAKEMWEAIKSRFGGNDESKKMQKYLSLPSSWSQVGLIMRTKPGLDTLSFDDPYNNLRVFKHDVRGTTVSSSNTQNVAFVSAENTSSTNDVSTAYIVSFLSVSKSQKEGSSSYTNKVIHSFTNQSSAPQLDYDDLEQINDDDIEEMDLKWQVAMISMRIKKFHKRTGRKLQFDTKAKRNQDSRRRDNGYSGTKLETMVEDLHIRMTQKLCNSGSDNEVKSCSKACEESYARLKKLYDDQRDKLGDASVEITAYTLALKRDLKDKEIVDSGCSRHMTGNKAHLADYQEFKGGSVAFGEELKHYNLFSVSQMRNKKNKVLFTNTDCLVLSPDFKLPDETQVLLKIPRQHNMYSFNLKNIDPSGDLSCLFAKALSDESNKWHRRLERKATQGLLKGQDNNFVNQPLQILHMDLFRPTSDETTPILKDLIRQAENQFNHKIKTIRSDNEIEFKNKELIEFCGLKGIKREYSNTKTLQQNRVAERKNINLIEAARTMVLVTKPQNKTPYELLTGKQLIISYLRPFRCHVIILNTIDQLGKFNGKSDSEFLVGYSLNSKAFRVYNLETKRVEKNPYVNFIENKPNVARKGYAWMFDLDYLTNYMNYEHVSVANQANKSTSLKEANNSAGTQANDDQGTNSEEINLNEEHFVLHIWSAYSTTIKSLGDKIEKNIGFKTSKAFRKEATHDIQNASTSSTNLINTASTPLSTAGPSRAFNYGELSYPDPSKYALSDDLSMPYFEDIYANPSERIFTDLSYDDEGVSAFLYGTIDEEVYVSQPPGFVDPKFHNKKSWCDEFEELMKNRFQMSSMGELTFFLGLLVKKKKDGNPQQAVVNFLAGDLSHGNAKSRLLWLLLLQRQNMLLLHTADEGSLSVGLNTTQQMVISSPCLIHNKNRKELASPKQTALSKDILNLLMADRLSKTTFPTSYALTASPKIRTSSIKQFWTMTKVKTINDEVRIQALIDEKRVNIKESSIRRTLNTMASAIIYLATNQKFNFSRYILLSLVKNIEAGVPFFMFSRFVQLLIDHQLGYMSHHKDIYGNPSLTKKVFANMKRVGTGFFGVVTPLFDNMLLPNAKEVGLIQADVKSVSIPTEPSTSKPHKKHKPKNQQTQAPKVPSPEPSHKHRLPSPSNDPLPGGKDSLKLKELMDLCTYLSNKVLELESEVIDIKSTYKERIEKLEGRVDMLEEENRVLKELHSVHSKVDTTAPVVEKEKSFKQGKIIADIDEDVEINLEEAQAKLYRMDLEHPEKVLIITAGATTTAEATKVSVPRRRRSVVIQDPKETTSTVVVHSEVQSKDKEKVIKYQALNRKPLIEAQAKKNMIIYLKNMAGYKMNYFKGMTYSKIRPLFKKYYSYNQAFLEKVNEEVTVPEKEIEVEGHKREDGNHMLFLSFSTLLKNSDREDLESLWKLVKESVWRDKKGRYGLAKRYPLIHFTLEQMLNNIRLEVEEESEMSLELLRHTSSVIVNAVRHIS